MVSDETRQFVAAVDALALSQGAEPGISALVSELVDMQWSLSDAERCSMHALLTYALLVAGTGSTCFAADDPALLAFVREAYRLAEQRTPPRLEKRLRELASDRAFSSLIGPPESSLPLVSLDGRLHLHRLWAREQRIATRLSSILRQPRLPSDVSVSNPSLSQEQRQAVVQAATQQFAIITGGPGTGKTTVIASLVQAWLDQGISAGKIVVCAPTGKAAHRLNHSIEQRIDAPQLISGTLHTVLEYAPSRGFRRNERFPLAVEAVVVDEASMVDLVLLDALLEALPESARLVLVGDKDQLAPVDAGAPFADLATDAPWTHRLNTNFRLACDNEPETVAVASAARSIIEDGALEAPAIKRLDDVCGIGLFPLTTARPLTAFLSQWRRRTGVDDIAAEIGASAQPDEALIVRNLDRLAQAQLLAVTRRGPRGADAINAFFLESIGAGAWYPGMPVMVTRNDYRLGVFNGDIGVLVRAERGLVAAMRSRDGVRLLPLRPLAIEPAFALTVHKSQGSEYDTVAVLLPEVASRACHRALLYTAVTRTSREVIVAGEASVLSASANNRLTRRTSLGTLLAP